MSGTHRRDACRPVLQAKQRKCAASSLDLSVHREDQAHKARGRVSRGANGRARRGEGRGEHNTRKDRGGLPWIQSQRHFKKNFFFFFKLMPSLSSPSPPESLPNIGEARAGKGSAMRSHPLRGRCACEHSLVKKGKGPVSQGGWGFPRLALGVRKQGSHPYYRYHWTQFLLQDFP